MDPLGQNSEKKELSFNSPHNIIEDIKEPAIRSSSLQDSDSSFSLAEEGQLNRRPSLKGSNDDIDAAKCRRGKHGLKYARISNKQREDLINKVTDTGCTIKSAALELNINFSTAKAIMQIYKKEGRSCKKIIRKNRKKRTILIAKRLQSSIKDQTGSASSGEEENRPIQLKTQIKVEHDQKDNKQYGSQKVTEMEECNRQQNIVIQQLTNQNYILQGQVNSLHADKMQLNQKYQYLAIQFSQMQQIVFNSNIFQMQTLMGQYQPYQQKLDNFLM